MQQGDWSRLTVSYLARNKTLDSLGLFSKFGIQLTLPNPADDDELKRLVTSSNQQEQAIFPNEDKKISRNYCPYFSKTVLISTAVIASGMAMELARRSFNPEN